MLWVTAAVVLLNVAFFVVFLFRSPRGGAGAGDTNASAAAPVQAGLYAVTGVVRELRADGSNVLIRHEKIPGFMEAMTMPFTARDPREVVSLQPGDRVTFRLLVTDDESWIDSVKRVGVTEPPPTFTYEQARVVRDVDPLELGQTMPDYVFTNQFGAPTKLSDFRGRAVGLTFVFTRCPLPEFCPRMLKNFSAVDAALQARSGGPTNIHLVTMTIDPMYDTAAVLRAHAERYQYHPARWTFLTGALIDVDAITEQVGLVFRRQTPDALPDHNVRTLVIDPQGRLVKTILGNTWKPEELVEDLVKAARP